MRALLSKASGSIWNFLGSMRPCSRASGRTCQQSLRGEKLQNAAALLMSFVHCGFFFQDFLHSSDTCDLPNRHLPGPPIKFPLLSCFPAGCAQTKAAWLFWVWEAAEVGAPSGCGGGGSLLLSDWDSSCTAMSLMQQSGGGSPLLGVQSGVQQQRGLKVSKKKKGFQGNSGNFLFVFNDKTA